MPRRQFSRPIRRGKYIDPNKFINKVVSNEVEEVFNPTHKFEDFKLDSRLKNAIRTKGYISPTPIQDMAIPQILNGSDVVGIANTGTGKTAAFLLPLVHKALQNDNEQIIVIVPTRELAIQINTELKSFTTGMKVFSACVYGGASIVPQLKELRYHNNFIIGTPGRLKDLIDRKMINLSKFHTLVLDEADRMLDMGFVNDMRLVVSLMPKTRQTLFFSATISPDIEKLIGEFLRNPLRISVKTRDTSKNVEQDVIRIQNGNNKFDVLLNLLKQPEFNKVLVFGRTKHGVDRLAKELERNGIKTETIHGNKNQRERERALNKFKMDEAQVLTATDVAARGLDISDISHVINYDMTTIFTE
jgi:superfamily II DNA/RNA helicase